MPAKKRAGSQRIEPDTCEVHKHSHDEDGKPTPGHERRSSLTRMSDFTGNAIRTMDKEWRRVAMMALVLAALAFAVTIAIDLNHTALAKLAPNGSMAVPIMVAVFGALALLLPAPLTHAFAGRKAHDRYSFFQPFVGGTTFVLLQGFGWAVYSITLLLIAWCLHLGMNKITPSMGLISTTGIGGILSQLFVLISLSYFDSTRSMKCVSRRHPLTLGCSCRPPGRDTSKLSFLISENLRDFAAYICTAMVFMLPLEIIALYVIPVFYFGHYALIFWACAFACYVHTFLNEPHRNGRRSWDFVRKGKAFWGLMERYFSGRIVAKGKLSPDQTYVYAFHPHGIYPITCFWATRGTQWHAAYPNVDMDVLGASIMFYVPIFRDILLWAGGRDVSSRSIEMALGSKRSVMLIPGGQREMRESHTSHKKVVLVTKHKGWIRHAMQYGAPLVPVFSFGENNILDNIRAPRVQEFFTRQFAFPFPHFPYGRAYTPIPNPATVTVVVGDPIPVPKVAQPTHEQIDAMHKQYYDALRQLFEAHKVEAGFPHCELVFK